MSDENNESGYAQSTTTTHPNQSQEEKNQQLWQALSQDIYVIRSAKEDVAYVPYQLYKNAPKLEWYNDNNDQHYCFLTANGYQPENLIGPALTKVIPWNIETAQPPRDYQGKPLQPGYLLDLRVLHMSRLLNPALQVPMPDKRLPVLQYPIGQPGGPLPKQAGDYSGIADDGFIPANRHYELLGLPYDNLYIASWKEPLAEHKIDDYDPYEITYLSSEALDRCESAAGISTGKTMTVLESYFKKANVQVGALNPRDWEYLSLHGACYVANLNSFIK